MAFYKRLDLLHLSEAFLRVSMKSQRSPDQTVLKIPKSHPIICRPSVSPWRDNLQPRAQHSRRPRLGLWTDFFFFFFPFWVVCECYALVEHISFHCSGLFSTPSLLRKCLNAQKVASKFFFFLKKEIWGDIFAFIARTVLVFSVSLYGRFNLGD